MGGDDLRSLLQRSVAGDPAAFGEIAARFQTSVLAWTHSVLRNRYDAEDAAQETFITAYRRLSTLRELDAFPRWLRRIAMTACRRRTRALARAEVLDVKQVGALESPHARDNPAARLEHVELREAIESAVRSLSSTYRACMRLHYLEGYSVNEVAHFLGVPSGTVKRRLHDARNRLRGRMLPFAPEKRGTMVKQLDGLKWHPAWTSHMGCVKGCLDYIAADTSLAWLFGVTGHAFIINISDVLCPSGPTALNTEMFLELAPNVGCRISGVVAMRRDSDFHAKQMAAWSYVRKCLDDAIPCYGWELDVPEYCTIHGYDEVGYHFSGPLHDDGAGPKPWQDLGATEIGCLDVYSVQQVSPAPVARAVKDALALALKHAKGPREWVFPGYTSGPAAFETWASAVEKGTALSFGHSYNAEVWAECRRQAVTFLNEARTRLNGTPVAALEESAAHYSVVASKLKAVRDLHPFRSPAESRDEHVRSPEAATLLREAGTAEAKGLESIRSVIDAL
jgi:RNA polymerase sigma factor (sigma-70 family)